MALRDGTPIKQTGGNNTTFTPSSGSGGFLAISFDVKGYERALMNAIKQVHKELRDELWQLARDQASALPFKDNPVRLAGGSYTSDRDRADELISSIIAERLEWVGGKVLRTAVSAMSTNFEESHIGVYYEYGTGENVEPDETSSKYLAMGERNPFRLPVAGSPIVTRSKFYKQGRWRDLGGNLRETDARWGGRRDEGFIDYVGEDLEAYHWFSKAFDHVRAKAKERYIKAIESVHFGKFIRLKPRIVLGGKRGNNRRRANRRRRR